MAMLQNRYFQSVWRIVACVYLYVFMEWLFFVTKPSFLSLHPWLNRILVLFTVVWPFLIAALFLHLILCAINWVLAWSGKLRSDSDVILRVVPTIIITSLAIMLFDNFTYTVFRWGIVKTSIYTIPIYWALFLLIFTLMIRHKPVKRAMLPRIATSLVMVSLVLVAWATATAPARSALSGIKRSKHSMPNIIMFASDGVNADHLSAYGYKRDTTPNLAKWLDKALIAENAVTNSGMTSGSLTAMMTGKYPATTKLFYPPQTLQGNDAYQHLPGILRKFGYDSLQETVPYYGDAEALNWLDSFNYANGRKLHWSDVKSRGVLQTSSQFARRIRDRLRDRVGQLLLTKPMDDAYAGVTSEKGAGDQTLSDVTRMNTVYDFIRHAHKPFFIHVHLMGTHLNGPHCCLWRGPPTFAPAPGSAPAEQDIANFDNAILQADRYFGQMMDLLRKQHLLDDTIVIYSSDHATRWAFNSTVPLIFIFPRGADNGRVTAPVQLIDVAPTLLDYMGVSVPDWMEGKSLLDDHLSFYRPIFVGYRAQYLGAASQHADIGPPLYDLAKEGMVVCNHWYVLTLADHMVTEGSVAGFRGTCDPAKIPDVKNAGAMMAKHLKERGFKF